MKRHSGRLFVFVLLLLGLILTHAQRIVRLGFANFQSLRCYNTLQGSKSTFALAPISQYCPSLEQAVDAIERGDTLRAWSLLRPLARSGNDQALQILVQLDNTLQANSEAVRLWSSVQDVHAIVDFAVQQTRDGDLTGAYHSYHLAWRLEPFTETAALANFLMNEAGDANAAAHIWQTTLAAYPNAFTPAERVLAKARVSAGMGHLREAAESYQHFVREFPNDAKSRAAYYELAWIYHHNGETLSAITSIEQALESEQLWPETWRVLQRAGQIYEAVGQTDRATAAYQGALRLSANAHMAADGLKRLTTE